MAYQVLVRCLPFGNMDGDNYPPPINVEICHFDNSRFRCRRRIVSPNNSPSRCRRVLPYENPEPKTVDCWMNEDILISLALKFFIRPRPSRSSLGVIEIQ